MVKYYYCLFILQVFAANIFAQQKVDSNFIESSIILKTNTGNIYGTLTIPKGLKKYPLAIIIAGSGPTDRNGNNYLGVSGNIYKKLAFALAENKIASLRYDKRGIGESAAAMKSEASIRFENYIEDVENWIDLFKKNKNIKSITIIGHSEGSQIGMVAASKANKYISIAGVGKGIDSVIMEQLAKQPIEVRNKTRIIFDSLKLGYTVKNIPPYLMSIFRPSIQPYMISWLKHNPQLDIQKVNIPILLLQGTKDLQVGEENVYLLSDKKPTAKVVIIKNMNHILFTIEGDEVENNKSYTNKLLPINEELVNSISAFILGK